MAGSKSRLKALRAHLRALEASGTLESGQVEAVNHAFHQLRRAVAKGKRRDVEKSIDALARVFIRTVGE